MTGDQLSQGSSPNFSNDYPLPEDQEGFEFSLLQGFRERFVDNPILESGLGALQMIAGNGLLNITNPQILSDAAIPDDGVVESLLAEQPPQDHSASLLNLKMPIQRTQEEISGMSEDEKRLGKIDEMSAVVVGELQPDAVQLLQGLYQLTGARVIRDDRKEGGKARGQVVRTGTYKGKVVCFVENYNDNSSLYEGQSTLNVQLLGPETAKSTIEAIKGPEKPSASHLDRLKRLGRRATGGQ